MKVIVVTSIADETHTGLKFLANNAAARKTPFILIGDTKSPQKFHLSGCDFYSIDRQLHSGLKIAENLPVRHYSRKNIGYLLAIKMGAEIIHETDDDNLPYESFWEIQEEVVEATCTEKNGWHNVYADFTSENTWPRGFPLELLKSNSESKKITGSFCCPIQQGLADENPDVDAVYRLIGKLPLSFKKREPVVLGKNTWCPFNSQNTIWHRKAFPLLYLPSFCSFRMTDIWRSLIAQRICWENDWNILFHNATVRQERNEHNYLKDFEDEISGYLNNNSIVNKLSSLKLLKGPGNIPENMARCYSSLIEIGLIEERELELLGLWIQDLRDIHQRR